MATYKPVLHHRKKKDGTKRLMIRITKDRKTVYISTEIYIEDKFWNANKSEIKSSHDLHAVYNSAIKKQIYSLQESEAIALIEGNEKTSREIKKLSNKTISDFLSYFAQQNEALKATRASTTNERYEYSYKKLQKYVKTPELHFRDIDKSWIDHYYTYLLSINNTNTANKEIETISGLIKKAIAEGYINNYLNPFFNYKLKKAIVLKDRLNIAEIETIENLKLEGPIDIFRDIFLLQYYAAGMRISDALSIQIKNIQSNRLEYTMDKTSKQRSILIAGKLELIINKYIPGKAESYFVFPILKINSRKQIESKTASANKALKEIAKLAKITKKITTHTARHSFADIARLKSKDIYSISKALGHSDIRITENYLSSLDMGENDDFLTSIID
jgi:site-specific recombinase XerD